ncbi:putative NPH3 domain-containing protein [Helianthus anomalus]
MSANHITTSAANVYSNVYGGDVSDGQQKAHPAICDMDRKKVCSLMDCQKLSCEARAHAAQNERLPVQTMVQQRLREMECSPINSESQNMVLDDISRLKKENQELKFELIKLKTRLKEIEMSNANKPRVNNATGTTAAKPSLPSKPPLPKKSFISLVTKKLGKITPFLHADGFVASGTRGMNKPGKDRRHSVS